MNEEKSLVTELVDAVKSERNAWRTATFAVIIIEIITVAVLAAVVLM